MNSDAPKACSIDVFSWLFKNQRKNLKEEKKTHPLVLQCQEEPQDKHQ